MIKVGINGACGRMGLRLVSLISQTSDMKLTLAVEEPSHPAQGKDIGLVAGLSQPLEVPLTSEISSKKADIILDFSTPAGTLNILLGCRKYQIPLLIGTTGLDQKQISRIKQASKTIPCLISANFSRGANLLFQIAPTVAQQLGKEVQIEIIETHHRFKKDAPSGSAIRLAESLKSVLPDRNIMIHSIRLGDVIGEHRIILGLPGERIELIHQVDNRDAFAYGALEAARWLIRAKPGFYTLERRKKHGWSY